MPCMPPTCCRAVKTLLVYLSETNLNVYQWLFDQYKANPIPRASVSTAQLGDGG